MMYLEFIDIIEAVFTKTEMNNERNINFLRIVPSAFNIIISVSFFTV